jgi:hypothetical protein
MTTDAPARGERTRWSVAAPAATVIGVVVLGITITWSFFSMRSVMTVGGSCADGGPYVSSQPCPDGSYLIAIAVPVMLLTAIFGSAAAVSINAPNLLIAMWAALFGSLGWNFLEFAFSGDGVVVGWLVCGVMFWLMAAPAVLLMLAALKTAVLPPDPPPPGTGSRWWVPAYAALGAIGFLLGAWSYHALS